MPKLQRRVLIVLGWYDSRLHRGIEKYALENNWHLSANMAREKVIPWGWQGDGILAWLGAGDDLAEFVMAAQKPTVDFSYRRRGLPLNRVLQDHAHAGALVAEHFLSRGFKHFFYYSEGDNWTYQERGEGFGAALRRAGCDFAWLRWDEPCVDQKQWTAKREWLMSMLKKAAKPLAIFAANDEQAVEILEACEEAGQDVPEEIAIVGAENNLLAPDAMRTPISSVDTNLEELGYRGAALLDKLMQGGKPTLEPVRIPAAGLIVRKSSDIVAVSHSGLSRSLRFICDHYNKPIHVKDLLPVAAMSRRGLHKAFVHQLGRTPGQEIQRMRIDCAKRLLITGGYKIEAVASLSGYQNANSFNVAFRHAVGMSPKQFRKMNAH